MSLTDRDLDDLFRGAESSYSAKYTSRYFKDIEAQLPIHKKTLGRQLFLLSLLILIPTGTLHYLVNTKLINRSAIEIADTHKMDDPENKMNAVSFSDASKTKAESIVQPTLPKISNLRNEEYIKEALATKPKNEHVTPRLETTAIKLSLPIFSDNKILKSSTTIVTGKKNSSSNFSISMHGGFEQSWVQSYSNSVNGTVALQAAYEMSLRNISINFGLGAQLTKIDNLKIEERTKIYDFSSKELEQSYKFGSMLSLTLPVSVSYQKAKHRFEAGLNTKINLLSTVYYKETIGNQTSKTSEGFTGVDLFNRFGLNPYLGYAYDVNNKLSIGINAGIALIKPTNSNRFKGDIRTNPIDFNFFIKRNLTWNR